MAFSKNRRASQQIQWKKDDFLSIFDKNCPGFFVDLRMGDVLYWLARPIRTGPALPAESRAEPIYFFRYPVVKSPNQDFIFERMLQMQMKTMGKRALAAVCALLLCVSMMGMAAPASAASVDIPQTVDSLEIGYTLPLSAGQAGVSWSSSDPAVATVDQNGVVTGHSMGKATITGHLRRPERFLHRQRGVLKRH